MTATRDMNARRIRTLCVAGWPEPDDGSAPPPVPGFIVSTFSPLAAVVAERCLGRAEVPPGRTAIILVTTTGDVASAAHVARTVDSGGKVGPLLFFQSVPNAVAGHIAARHGLTGPIVAVSVDPDVDTDVAGSPSGTGARMAALLIADGDADSALVISVEQDPDRAHAALLATTTERGNTMAVTAV